MLSKLWTPAGRSCANVRAIEDGDQFRPSRGAPGLHFQWVGKDRQKMQFSREFFICAVTLALASAPIVASATDPASAPAAGSTSALACAVVLAPSAAQTLQAVNDEIEKARSIMTENPDAKAVGRQSQSLSGHIQKIESRVAEMITLFKKRDSLIRLDQLAEEISFCRGEVERCTLDLKIRVKAVLEHLDQIEAMRIKLHELDLSMKVSSEDSLEKDRLEIQKVLADLDLYQLSLRRSLKQAQMQVQDGQNLKYQIMKLLNSGAPSKTLDVMDEKTSEKWLIGNPAMQSDGVSPKLKALIQSDTPDGVLAGALTFVRDGSIHRLTATQKVTDVDILYILERIASMSFTKGAIIDEEDARDPLPELLTAIAGKKVSRILPDEKWVRALNLLDRLYEDTIARHYDDRFLQKKEEIRLNLHLQFAQNLSTEWKTKVSQAAQDRAKQVETLFNERGYSDFSWKYEHEPSGNFFGLSLKKDRLKNVYGDGFSYYRPGGTRAMRTYGDPVYDGRWGLQKGLESFVFVTPFRETKDLKFGGHYKIKPEFRSEIEKVAIDTDWDMERDARLIGFFASGDVLLRQENQKEGTDTESFLRVGSVRIEATGSDDRTLAWFRRSGLSSEEFEKYKDVHLFQYKSGINGPRRLLSVWEKLSWIDKDLGHVVSYQNGFMDRSEVVLRTILDPELKALGIREGGTLTIDEPVGPGATGVTQRKYFVFGTFLNGSLCVGEIGNSAGGFYLSQNAYPQSAFKSTGMPEVMPLWRARKANPASLRARVRKKWRS
jgi:hypothetical protein